MDSLFRPPPRPQAQEEMYQFQNYDFFSDFSLENGQINGMNEYYVCNV